MVKRYRKSYSYRRKYNSYNPTNYNKYIRSEEWRKKAAEKRAEVGHCCELCSSSKSLQVHHLTYERLGAELMGDLQVLCGDCHMRAHGIEMVFKDGQWVKVIRCKKGV